MSNTIVDVPLGTSASQLQSMIDAASSGTTFQLQAGDYTFNQTVVIAQSGISLIGAGSGETTIYVTASVGNDPAIRIGHELHQPEIEDTFEVTASASAGETSIQVEAGHSFVVGDFMYITQENTSEFFEEIGDTSWRKDKELRTILVEVTEVDGQNVSFNSPLTFDYDPAISTVQKRTLLHDNEVSGFTMVGPFGEADASNFNNVQGAYEGATMIMVGGLVGGVFDDITMNDARVHVCGEPRLGNHEFQHGRGPQQRRRRQRLRALDQGHLRQFL